MGAWIQIGAGLGMISLRGEFRGSGTGRQIDIDESGCRSMKICAVSSVTCRYEVPLPILSVMIRETQPDGMMSTL